MEPSEPILWLSIEPTTRADQEKLDFGLGKLMVEDATFGVKADTETGQVVIVGTDALHLEVVVDRLQREFGVEAKMGAPQVAYKETITKTAQGEGRYISQIGGRGQYGHVKIRISPRNRDEGYEFESESIGGSIPKEFIKPVDQGIRDALTTGVLAGYPMDDVKIDLYDGSYHEVDSSEMAFKIAGAMAFKDAARRARPVLLEPVMRVEVVVPEMYTGEVLGILNSRRGHIQSMVMCGGSQVIKSRAPLAEMLGSATDIRMRTQGRGSCSMHFDRYEPVQPGSDTDEDGMSPAREPSRPRPKTNNPSTSLPEPRSEFSSD
jgi:elongation factor G